MCGRFVSSSPVEDVVAAFEVDVVEIPPELYPEPRFNVSPQSEVLAVRAAVPRVPPRTRTGETGETGLRPTGRAVRRLGTYRWGLVPSWAKDPRIGLKAFNARADGLEQKAMFKTALAKRRCIIPADAFYEWQRLPDAPGGARSGRGRRQPWCYRARDGGILAFAGLYEVWRDRTSEGGEWLLTCSIITTAANELMAPVHDRMPVILSPDQYETWLAPGSLDPIDIAALLAPPPNETLAAYEVGPEVGNSSAEGPQLTSPLSASSLPSGTSPPESRASSAVTGQRRPRRDPCSSC